MKQYATNNAVEWLGLPGVTSYAIDKDPKSGKYSVNGLGGFMETPSSVTPSGDALTIKDGVATIVERSRISDPVGTKVALFTETEAMTSNSKYLITTDGSQYIGTVEKTLQGWEPTPVQPSLPDQIHTSTSPWQYGTYQN